MSAYYMHHCNAVVLFVEKEQLETKPGKRHVRSSTGSPCDSREACSSIP